jgi:hypothetical protein
MLMSLSKRSRKRLSPTRLAKPPATLPMLIRIRFASEPERRLLQVEASAADGVGHLAHASKFRVPQLQQLRDGFRGKIVQRTQQNGLQ